MEKEKLGNGHKVQRASEFRKTAKTVFAVTVIVMLVGTMLILTPPSESEKDWEYQVDEHTIGLWHLNEGTDLTAYDETDNNNDGTLKNEVNWTTDSKFGSHALEFDGEDDYVEVPHDDSMNVGSGNFTVECWINTTQTEFPWYDEKAVLVNKADPSKNPNWDLTLRGEEGSKGKVRFAIRDNSMNRRAVDSTSVVNDGIWHHIAGIRDGNILRIYIDGIEENQTDCSSVGSVDNNYEMHISMYNDAMYYDGIIDEIRISNISRTKFNIPPTLKLEVEKTTYYHGEEVNLSAIYSGDSANITFEVDDPDGNPYLIKTIETQLGKELEADEHTVALWHFNEGEGDTVYDETDNNNNGTRNGTTWIDGKFGKALEFNGDEDYVEVSQCSVSDNTELTIEAWIYPTEFGGGDDGYRCIVTKGDSGENDRNFIFLLENDKLRFAIYNPKTDPNPPYVVEGKSSLQLNSWYHVAAVYKGGEYLKVFLNGVEDGNYTTSVINNYDGSNVGIRIGAWKSTSYKEFFNGSIDEIRISNIIRTDFNLENKATLTFSLPKDAKIGTYTVYATNDKDSANDTITFEVLQSPIPILKDFKILTPTINPGDTFEANLTIYNPLEFETTTTLVLQVMDSNNEAIAPAYEEKTLLPGENTYKLTVKIPNGAKTGTYSCQGQLLTDLPRDGGYCLGFVDDTFEVV